MSDWLNIHHSVVQEKANDSPINVRDGLSSYFNHCCKLFKFFDLHPCKGSPQQLHKVMSNKCEANVSTFFSPKSYYTDTWNFQKNWQIPPLPLICHPNNLLVQTFNISSLFFHQQVNTGLKYSPQELARQETHGKWSKARPTRQSCARPHLPWGWAAERCSWCPWGSANSCRPSTMSAAGNPDRYPI